MTLKPSAADVADGGLCDTPLSPDERSEVWVSLTWNGFISECGVPATLGSAHCVSVRNSHRFIDDQASAGMGLRLARASQVKEPRWSHLRSPSQVRSCFRRLEVLSQPSGQTNLTAHVR